MTQKHWWVAALSVTLAVGGMLAYAADDGCPACPKAKAVKAAPAKCAGDKAADCCKSCPKTVECPCPDTAEEACDAPMCLPGKCPVSATKADRLECVDRPACCCEQGCCAQARSCCPNGACCPDGPCCAAGVARMIPPPAMVPVPPGFMVVPIPPAPVPMTMPLPQPIAMPTPMPAPPAVAPRPSEAVRAVFASGPVSAVVRCVAVRKDGMQVTTDTVCTMRIVAEGANKVAVQYPAMPRMTCENLEVAVGEGQCLKIGVCDKQVAVCSPCLKAKADSLTRVGQEERIILEGHVRICYAREGQEIQATADRVTVDLKDGKCQIEGCGSVK